MKTVFPLFIVLMYLLTACETVVKIDVPREPSKLVVNSYFNPDSTFHAHVFTSRYVLDEDTFPVIRDALVKVYDENEQLVTEMVWRESQNEWGQFVAKYVSDVKPQPGKRYTIEVENEGFETVYGSDEVPEDTIQISNLTTELSLGDYGMYKTTFDLIDGPEKNYYELAMFVEMEMYKNDTLIYRDTRYEYLETDDPLFGDGSQYGLTILFNDDLFNGKTEKISFLHPGTYGNCEGDICYKYPHFDVVLRSVSESYYKYKTTVKLQNDLSGDPFGEPVNVFNNIEQGYGIFAGYNNSMFRMPIVPPLD